MKRNYHFISLLFLFFGSFLSFFLLSYYLNYTNSNPEEDLLNPGTSVLFEQINGNKIHCKGFDDIDMCINHQSKSNSNNFMVWFGNSQLHAINQYKIGQTASTSLLYEKLKKMNLNFFTLSYGNANIQEHALQFIYLKNKIRISKVIVGLVFDDTREDGVREDVYNFIVNDSVTKKIVNNYHIGKEIILSKQSKIPENESEKNLQNKLEKFLVEKLESISVFWEKRSEINYYFFVSLRKFRNFIFNIKPTSKRKIIPNTYKKNLNSLIMLLDEAKINNIDVLLYIAPIRNDLKLPYDMKEYANFKNTIKNLSIKYNIEYYNLEDIIPNSYWGEKQSTTLGDELEVDFMHFNHMGHNVLANKLFEILNK